MSNIPVLNAGDGPGEHPTQALLDIYTIHQVMMRNTLDNVRVTFVGDLKYGRTVHSLSKLLALYDNVTINMVSPDALRFPQELMPELEGCEVREGSEFESFLPETDILYMTRIQQERFPTQEEYEKMKSVFVLTPKELENAPSTMSILHPLPRVDEISPEVDSDPRAKYFDQVRYGLHTRMALLALALGKL